MMESGMSALGHGGVAGVASGRSAPLMEGSGQLAEALSQLESLRRDIYEIRLTADAVFGPMPEEIRKDPAPPGSQSSVQIHSLFRVLADMQEAVRYIRGAMSK